MKKFLICCLFLFIPFFLLAQEVSNKKYIDGYEDLAWGTSIDKVRTKYPNLSKEYSAECISGEECYSASSGSVNRIFRFYNNKLYWVRVIYNDLTQTQFDALGDKLKEKYGQLFYEMDPDDTLKFGYEWYLFSDLVVNLTVNKKINGYGVKLGEWVGVTYYSISILEEMQKAESDNIEL